MLSKLPSHSHLGVQSPQLSFLESPSCGGFGLQAAHCNDIYPRGSCIAVGSVGECAGWSPNGP